MSSKSDALENQLLLHIFNNSDITLVGDATGLRGSSTAGSLYVSLHKSDPGEAGNQATNEVVVGEYGQYARQAVARSGAGWTVTGNSCSPAADISFPVMSTGSGVTATHFGVGTDSTGNGKLLYYGELTPDIVISAGVTPRILASGTTITES